ncbi:hypothetical protein [Petrotoga sp. 9PWA.NaAc.5.4]|uniref:hypothetical protein n=1 Tax=Petrotoga sp. 9PWA.NaAc.5.4 TaxID=1434328 RepID=UPI000CB027D4|nr:hypothetical protein [Petrotoga sp. 9PWA.NaAc.5.4]PNR96797.1 hypothetical protein X924_01445 [Petrotoga sp. 9PWA.NaAc.5.4]
MFVRTNKSGNNRYMNIVESYREKGSVKQRVLWSLGKYEEKRYKEIKENIKEWEKIEGADESASPPVIGE